MFGQFCFKGFYRICIFHWSLLLLFHSLAPRYEKERWPVANLLVSVKKKEANFSKKTYRTLFNAPKQNCMRNLERFWQSSLLSKILNALFPPNPSIITPVKSSSLFYSPGKITGGPYKLFRWENFPWGHFLA